MPFLEDMHLPKPKLVVVNEKRSTDFTGHYFKTHVNNRAENSLLISELFPRYFVQIQLIQGLPKSRGLTAAPQHIGWGHSCTLPVNCSPVSALIASKAAGIEPFLHFFCNITSQEQLLPQFLKNDQTQRDS